MDWLLGCFGGVGKKARKHAASQKTSQRALRPLPVKVPPPSSIAVTGFTIKEEETNSEDLVHERRLVTRTPAKDAAGTIQETAERTPEKPTKGDPWSQLDDLEDELEDLRKQIEKETIDAKKIKEEVTFLRSCGTLLQTPAELRKKDKPLEPRQDGTPSKGWHSWLVPLSSPPSKLLCNVPSESHCAYQGSEAVHSPPDAVGAMPHGPLVENQKNRNYFNSETPVKSTHGPIRQTIWQGKEKSDSSLSHPQNSVAASGRNCDDCLEFSSGIKRAGSPCKDGVAGIGTTLVKQCSITPKDDYFKSEGGVIQAPARDNFHLIVPCTVDAALMHEDYQSKFQVLTTTFSPKGTKQTSSNHLEQVHAVNAIHGREIAQVKSTPNISFEVQATPKLSKHRYHIHESSDCASHMVPHSISTMEMTESERCQSSSCNDHFLVSDKKHHNEEDEDSACRSHLVRDDESPFHTFISRRSSSMDSEETLTDLSSTEECLMPSKTPRTCLESVTNCKVEGNSSSFYADETASTSVYSHGSTRNSITQPCRRKAEAARYDLDYLESEDDLLFADLSSRISASAECSHLHTRGRNKQRSRLVGQEIQDLIQTPNKMLQWQDTPEPPRPLGVRSRPASPVLTPVENALQWRQLKRKDENVEKDFNKVYDAESGTHFCFDEVSAFADTSLPAYRAEQGREEGWDENEEREVSRRRGYVHAGIAPLDNCKISAKQKFIHTNMSLSNWLTPPQPVRGGSSENLTTVQLGHNVVDVEIQSSPWTPRHSDDLCGEFKNTSNGAAEPCTVCVDMSLSNWLHVAPKQDEAKGSAGSPTGLSMQRFPSQCVNERPILGLITGDINSHSAPRRVPWDGKGIPNTTTKYKEDQRVNWHATPFEARLERALDKQGKLYEVAQATPVSNRLKSLQ